MPMLMNIFDHDFNSSVNNVIFFSDYLCLFRVMINMMLMIGMMQYVLLDSKNFKITAVSINGGMQFVFQANCQTITDMGIVNTFLGPLSIH